MESLVCSNGVDFSHVTADSFKNFVVTRPSLAELYVGGQGLTSDYLTDTLLSTWAQRQLHRLEASDQRFDLTDEGILAFLFRSNQSQAIRLVLQLDSVSDDFSPTTLQADYKLFETFEQPFALFNDHFTVRYALPKRELEDERYVETILELSSRRQGNVTAQLNFTLFNP